MNSLMVGLGGFIGANLRYWAGIIIPAKGALPITFFINIIGALLIGLVSGWAMKSAPNPQFVLFLKVGLCGGFTTFSSFSLEAWQMIESGKYALAVVYCVLSVILCIAAVVMGESLVK